MKLPRLPKVPLDQVIAWLLIISFPVILVLSIFAPMHASHPTWPQIADHIVTLTFLGVVVWRVSDRRPS